MSGLTSNVTQARASADRAVVGCAVVLSLFAPAMAADLSPAVVATSAVPSEDVPAVRRDDGFVSSAACLECHVDEHASWKASYHRTMTQLAIPEAVLGRFDGSEIDSDGVKYKVFEREGKYWAEMPDPDVVMDLVQMQRQRDAIKQIPRVERQVIMTTGSHHYQTYWVAGDDRYGRLLQTLPLVYLPEDDRWIPRELAFMRPPGDRFLTQWTHHCIKCHSTGGVPGLVEDGKRGKFDTRVAELGIACEACHGPGEEHVAHHRLGEHFSADQLRERGQSAASASAADPTIVNPARLDNKRSSMVCGQCHGVFIAADEEHGMHFAHHGESYRPGDDIHESRYYIQHPKNDPSPARSREYQRNRDFFRERWWDDGSILAGGREFTAMSSSECYLRGEMSCLSCHSMHDSDPADQLQRGLSDNQMCTQCHTEAEYNAELSKHTHHLAGSQGSNCLNCHMPYNAYALFSSIRSHQMGSPSVSDSIDYGTPNACNLCHLDKTLAWAQKHTESWYEHEPSPLSDDERKVAAGVLWMLSGDAAQRATAAWSAGWAPAREASGDDWVGLYLSRLLDDPYSVVRHIANDSLRRSDSYNDFEYDFVAPRSELTAAARSAVSRWAATEGRAADADPALLLRGEGRVNLSKYNRLFRKRDNRPVTIKE